MRLSASQLGTFDRCPTQFRFEKIDRLPGVALSRTLYGTVSHHALHAFERTIARLVGEGWDKRSAVTEARTIALDTFDYFWHPYHIEELCEEQVSTWIMKDSYGSLRQLGLDTLKKYADLWLLDEHVLLSLEHPFEVPVVGTLDDETGEPHTLSGYVDRLVLRRKRGAWILDTDDWKGLALDTPLPTPTGWTTMGAVQVGDALIGADGQMCQVTAVSDIHERTCFRVTFDDSSSVVCDDEHLWAVRERTPGSRLGATQVLETWQLGPGMVVENSDAWTYSQPPGSIKPYVLGAWIGDGKATSGEITSMDDELYAHIDAENYIVGPNIAANGRCQTRTVYDLRGHLRLMGLLGHKAIPDAYLRAREDHRLALLQGLMDTDGTWNRQRRQASFTTTDKALAYAVRELVLSLGVTARVWELTKRGFGQQITAYDVTFTPDGFMPFRLSRKAKLVEMPPRNKARRRLITDVQQTLTVPTKCVAVDSPDSTYLCGETAVVTHNTGKRKYNLRHHLGLTVYCYASTQPGFWAPFADLGYDPDEMFAAYEKLPRHANWYDLQGFALADAGFRGPQDYARLARAVTEQVRSIQASIFPLRISGDTCTYCPHQDYCPDGLGLPAEQHGAPGAAA